ncbi:Maf family nucleotide pyrophosphatase [uncultured Devosia sp.]|uniref:Maf family nucleotide pyrophosphatase n=1 Tax=uncultured Devosia sp. TaxID=211434 RepID=UPI0035CB3C68
MLILASASSTRKVLLAQAGLAFRSIAATLDERVLETQALANGADGRDIALLLAEAKAKAIAAIHPDAIVIGADQTLALGTELLHKPADRTDAARQLDRLKGKTHRLHAAVTLVKGGTLLWSDVQTAELTLRDFSDRDRDDVLDREGDAILHAVGGYRLEGPSIRLFKAVNGDYFTILGLPLLPLLAALRDHAPHVLEDRPA